jgi:gliding motility-associated protein GldL
MYFSSQKGKRVLGFCYSIGAAVVIIGALFKILHLPSANLVLTVAMITEALVFVISGFERPNSEYHWEEVFPVLSSKNPLDRPDFVGGGSRVDSGTVIVGGGTADLGGGTANLGGGVVNLGGGAANLGGGAANLGGGAANLGGGTIIIGGMPGMAATGQPDEGRIANGSSAGGGVTYAPTAQPSSPPSPQHLVNAGMATMGLNISEKDSELLAESIKKLNSAAEQISKMADLTEATQTYIDQISTVSRNLEKFTEITGSLGEVSDTLIKSCKVISGSAEGDGEEKVESYVYQMSKLNENVSGLNQFYETQLSGLRSQMETVYQINAGLNRIRDLYDSSIVDSAAFRNENERMAQLLTQLNQVYSRLLQAMTVNIQGGGYPPAGQSGYQQPPYQGGYPPQGGYR